MTTRWEREFDRPKRQAEERSWRHNNPRRTILYAARQRAKKKDLDFELILEDIFVPEFCPVLGLKLDHKFGTRGHKDASPTLDRLDNTKGYTRDNIRIISHKANFLKNCNTRETLLRLVDYIDGKI